MSRYSNDKSPSQDRNNGMGLNGTKVETRLCQSTGKQHPYARENNHLSRFPVNFR